MKNIILSIGFILISTVLSAQNVFEASGERSTQKISVPKYTKIAIDEMLDVALVNEKNDHIYIDADNAIHPIIKTTVEEGTLKVALKLPKGVNIVQTGGITVKIPVKGTEELQMKMGKLSSDEPIKLASYKIKLDYVSELNLDLNIQELDLKISSCRKGELKLNCKNLTFEAGSLSGLAISGKAENATFVSNGIANIEAYDLKIQDATFDNSSILKAKLYINGTIQGKTNGIFELRYKGNAISRIEPSPMVKIIKEEKE